MTKQATSSIVSSFWMNEDPDSMFTDLDASTREQTLDAFRTYRLAAHRRAIANFVRIVTNKNIPVIFNTAGTSYTDNKKVVIGSNIVKPKDFDATVGVAIHEASHILLTDFSLFGGYGKLNQEIEKRIKDNSSLDDLRSMASERGFNLIATFKDLCNIIEDRRIDAYIYKMAPGYREYYLSMYDKYFNNKIIDKALLSNEKTNEDFDSYFFRIINLHSRNSNYNALKHLGKIAQLIDLPNILRLQSTSEVADVAMDVLYVLFDAILPLDQQEEQQQQNDQSKDAEREEGEGEGGGSSEDSEEGEPLETSGSATDGESGSYETQEFEPTETLTEKQKTKLDTLIEKQKDFIDGKVQKTKITIKENKTIQAIEESDSTIEMVGDEKAIGRTECIVVRRLTQQLVDSGSSPILNSYSYGSHYRKEVIEKGIRLGKQLVRKIQTRSEERDTVYNRQKTGRIDRRMLSALGYGYESVFYNTEIDKYKKANIHLSLDLSWSMSGDRFNRAMINAVAMAYAFDQIPGIEIQISLRATISEGRRNDLPYLLIAYDSRQDKLSKIRKLFPYIECNGTTPEGLCFEAIQNEIVKSSGGIDSYFVNISDGEPWFNNSTIHYGGESAARHVKGEMDNMRSKGVRILSYFVGSSFSNRSRIFDMCYGKDASYIDCNDMNKVAKAVNELLMKKAK